MQRNVSASIIVGTDIHGFHSMEDLDMVSVLEESKARWLRPNEIYAILCNYHHFNVQVRPVTLPPSGTLVLFDRKKLRNFRKDGHNWKKKNDGKTVKEAHEHLKVGNEERIHVYYAHGEDNPTFVRRCYWLLDKSLEHIVLVHYRETREGSAATPVNSNSSSGLSAPSPTWPLPGVDFVVDQACYTSQGKEVSDSIGTMNIRDHELTLHQINTLDWDELLVPEDSNKPIIPEEGGYSFGRSYPPEVNGHIVDCGSISDNKLPAQSYVENFTCQISASNPGNFKVPVTACLQNAAGQINSNSQNKNSVVFNVALDDLMEKVIQDGLKTEDSFEPWMNDTKIDSFVSMDAAIIESSTSATNQCSVFSPTNEYHLHSVPDRTFYIADVSPSWGVSTEETKILVVGRICEGQSELLKSNLFCVCGDVRIRAEVLQPGVFRCVVPPQTPGVVNLFLSLDGQKPLSQVVTFEFRAPKLDVNSVYSEDNSSWQAILLQMRLAKLLFSTSRSISILSSKVSQDNLKKAKNFLFRISNIENSWANLAKAIDANQISFPQAKNKLFELALQNRMYEWLLESVIEGSKICERDPQGQGVIHLCAMLDYLWAVYPFSWSGLSLDYRDKFGWTALHWAAYYGREKMVAKLLSAGAKASLVTDPTPESTGGYTAADLASKSGHEGLAAYLAEKGLVQHFQEMTLAGNVSGYLQPLTTHSLDAGNFSEEESYLKDTLAAYRTAADAAARIQTAFRQRSLKTRTRSVESSNPEAQARKIIAAMKIQHAFRKYDTGKKMVAAARIQHGFRCWKMRKDFLNKRRQVIKIQAAFRGFQARKHYSKIIWSVGVLEKAILRWRLKRKGIRGLQVTRDEVVDDEKQENDGEEDFFKLSRQLAEDRVERSVVRVQALFRSKRAQEEYRRMKLAFSNATVEYDWTT